MEEGMKGGRKGYRVMAIIITRTPKKNLYHANGKKSFDWT
jgi:hypothetical protein